MTQRRAATARIPSWARNLTPLARPHSHLLPTREREDFTWQTLLLHIRDCPACVDEWETTHYRLWDCRIGRQLYLGWRALHARLESQLNRL